MNDPFVLDGSSLDLEHMEAISAGVWMPVRIVKPSCPTANCSVEQLESEQDPLGQQEESLLDSYRDYVQYEGERWPSEIGLLSLYLLLNHALKHDDRLSDGFVERVFFFVNNRIEPCLNQANMTEMSAMSELMLILYGEEELICRHQEQFKTIGTLFQEIGLNKLRLSKEDMAFMTSHCCVSTAMAIYVATEASRLTKTADICVAMQLEAIRGETGAFDRRLHELGRPYASQIEVAENIRRIIGDSEFTTERGREAYGGDNGPRCQDAISIRAVPQTHGGVRDTVKWLKEQLSHEINTISGPVNPLLGYLLDMLTVGLIDLGNISERRSFRLLDSKMSYGLPMNLVGVNPGFNHGFPVIQASAAGILGEMKLLAVPATLLPSLIPSRKNMCAPLSILY